MNALLSTPVLPSLAWGLIGIGILLWFWGTLPLLLRRSIFFDCTRSRSPTRSDRY